MIESSSAPKRKFLTKINRIKYTSPMWIVILIGLAVRLILAPISAHPWDMTCWITVSQQILKNGIFYPYTYEYTMSMWLRQTGAGFFYEAYAYPPVWGLICAAMYSSWLIVGNGNIYLLYTFFKLPLILSDILVAVLLYKIIKEVTGNEFLSRNAFSWFYFSVYVIWIGSIWCMFDSLVALFLLLSLYLFNKDGHKNVIFSALCFGMAVSLKIYPILLLPIYIILFLKTNKTYTIRFTAYSCSLIATVSMPFLIYNAQDYLFTTVIFHSERIGGGVTYWYFIRFAQFVAPNIFNFTLSTLLSGFWIIIFTIGYVIWILYVSTWKFNPSNRNDYSRKVTHTILGVMIIWLATSKLVNEQYFVATVPLMILSIIHSESSRMKLAMTKLTVFVTLFIILNALLPTHVSPDLRDITTNFFFAPLSSLIPAPPLIVGPSGLMIPKYFADQTLAFLKTLSLFALGIAATGSVLEYLYHIIQKENTFKAKPKNGLRDIIRQVKTELEMFTHQSKKLVKQELHQLAHKR